MNPASVAGPISEENGCDEDSFEHHDLCRNPTSALGANAEGENAVIAPNTWVEIKGRNLARANASRIWQSSDFVNH